MPSSKLLISISLLLAFNQRYYPLCIPAGVPIRPLLDLGTGNSRRRIVLTMPYFQDLGLYMMVIYCNEVP
jgi:hypothetical protein